MLKAAQEHIAVPDLPIEYDTFAIRRLTPHIGAEISGIDLAALSPAQADDVHRAWLDWKVLVFRDQTLTREQHKAFALRFGQIHVHPLLHAHKGGAEVMPVLTNAHSLLTAGDGWHTDVTCDEVPPLASMLHIKETPRCGGGDTLFADMVLAFELLSAPLQTFLEGLSAIHDGAIPYVGSYGVPPPEGGYPRAQHPVVARHPETGKKILYVNAGFTSHIVELSRAESDVILDLLYRHIEATPRLCCRVQWQPNTLTLWDNRCTQHHALWDYYPHTRAGERVSVVAGDRPSR